jgi:exopolysaccharide biosynthesis protein
MMVVKKKEGGVTPRELVVSFLPLLTYILVRLAHISGVEFSFFLLSHTTLHHIMDNRLTPPHRIQIMSVIPISTKTTRKRLKAFLDDFQARSTSAQGGNTAVTVQLQKLMDVLKEERVMRRKDKKSNV